MHSLTNLLLSKQPKNNSFYTIAIDGRGGSGKSQLSVYLKTLLPDFIFLNGDDYFEPLENQIIWGEFNDKRFIQDVIKPLKTDNTFIYKPFTWNVKKNISEKEINIKKGICIERCYSFAFDLDWDLKIWMETPKEICIQRGLYREHMPHDRALKALTIWQEKEDQYIQSIQPQGLADIIIDGTKSFAEQIKM